MSDYGGMRSQDRQAALQSIKMDKSCKVLLMTIQSGSMGLNITSCNNVVLLEPWWNPYLEVSMFVNYIVARCTESLIGTGRRPGVSYRPGEGGTRLSDCRRGHYPD